MSQRALKTFLQKLDKNLKKDSKDYRQLTANKKDHTFQLTKAAIKRALRDSIERSENIALTQKEMNVILKDLNKSISTFIDSVQTNFNRSKTFYAKKNNAEINVSRNSGGLSVTIVISGDRTTNVFTSIIKAQYLTPLNDLYEKFLNTLYKHTGQRSLTFANYKGEIKKADSGDVFNLEHAGAENSSNVHAFIEDAAFDAFTALSSADKVLLNKDTSFLRDTGYLLGINRLIDATKKGKQTISVFLGSAVANNEESHFEKKVLPALKRDLVTLLASADLPNLSSSDSVNEVEVKKAKIKLLKPHKNKTNKRVKKTLEDPKLKGAKKSEKLNVGGRTTKGSNRLKTKVKRKRLSGNIGSSNINVGSVLGVLNQQLPKTLAKNMNSPALNYRSGRFASSVKAVDITQTQKGFPSIGFTYQKYPYQTFEPGFAQGSTERDPRRLIEGAIREIMVSQAIGRFYTRRL